MWKQTQAAWRASARYSAVGLEIIISIVLGTWAGHWLDKRWHTTPCLLFGGFALGLGAAGLSLWKLIKYLNAPQK